MSSFYYRLGRRSLEKAQEAASVLHEELGKVVPYISEKSLEMPNMRFSFWILYSKENIKYIESGEGLMGTVRISFMEAMIKSDKLVMTEEELEKYLEKHREEEELFGEEL